MTDAERVIRAHAHDVAWTIITDMLAHFDEIVALSIERSGPGSIGETEYPGDPSFRKTPTQLRTERFQEHADAIFYGSVEREITTQG